MNVHDRMIMSCPEQKAASTASEGFPSCASSQSKAARRLHPKSDEKEQDPTEKVEDPNLKERRLR